MDRSAAPGTRNRPGPPTGDVKAMQRTMTYAEMDEALQAGLAAPIGHAIAWLVKYQERWWVLWERGWLLIDDESATAELDELAEDLARFPSGVRDAVLSQTLRPEMFDLPGKEDKEYE